MANIEKIMEYLRSIKEAVPNLKKRIFYEADFARIVIAYSPSVPVTAEDINVIKGLPFVTDVTKKFSDHIILVE